MATGVCAASLDPARLHGHGSRVTDAGAYRTPAAEPAFVCIVCFANASVHAAACPGCDVAMAEARAPEVLAQLRERAGQRRHRPRRSRVVGAALLVLSAPVMGVAFRLGDAFYLGRVFRWVACALLLVAWLATFFVGVSLLAARPRPLDDDLHVAPAAWLIRQLGLRVVDDPRR